MNIILLAIISAAGIGAGLAALMIFGNISPALTPSHEWKSFAAFDFPGLNSTYQVGDTARFFVVKNGYGNMPCITPKITLYREEEPHALLVNYTNTSILCPVNMTGNYSMYFPSKTEPFVVLFEKPGSYVLNMSFTNDKSIQSIFPVTLSKQTSIRDTAFHSLSVIHPRCEYYPNNTVCLGMSMAIDNQNRDYDESPVYDYLNRPVEIDNVTFLYTGSSTPEKDNLNCDTEFPRTINVTFGHHPPIVVFDGYHKVNETRHFAVRFADGTTNSTILCWAQFTKPEITEMKDTGLGGVPIYTGMKITWLDKNKTAGIIQHRYQTEDYYNEYIAEVRTPSIDDTYDQKMNGTLSGGVALAGGPRAGPQANYEVDVYAADGIAIVGKTLSDDKGNYSIHLPAGNYTIYAPDYPARQTHAVSVFPGKNTVFNIVYGIGYK